MPRDHDYNLWTPPVSPQYGFREASFETSAMNRVSAAKFRRLVAWCIGPCLPAWAGLAGLALFGRLTWWDAAITGFLIIIVLTPFILSRLKDIDATISYAETLLDNPEAPPPALTHSATAVRLLGAMTALQRLWAERRDQAEATARSRQNIIDALPDPLLLLDRRRRVRSANAAARELFNLDTASPQGGRLVADRDLAGLIRDPKVLEAVDMTLDQRRATAAQFVLPSPVERTYRALVVPLPEPVEETSAVIVALSDETERLKVERMRADFVANASHELRTPLAAVLGFIETLRGPAKDDEKARMEFLDIMFKQASRMARLIDDLLSLSRIELREHARPADAID
ncbi:MAG: PAS domain-containing protein, partial [Rhodospirillaceae bacterium]